MTFDVYEAGDVEPIARVHVLTTNNPKEAASKACEFIAGTAGDGDYSAVEVKGVDMYDASVVA